MASPALPIHSTGERGPDARAGPGAVLGTESGGGRTNRKRPCPAKAHILLRGARHPERRQVGGRVKGPVIQGAHEKQWRWRMWDGVRKYFPSEDI